LIQIAYGIAAVIVLLPLAVFTWRGWAVHRLLAITALALAIASAVLIVTTTHSVLLPQSMDGAYHDTYYVVAHGHWIISLTALFLVLFGLHWAAHRWARPTGTRLAIASVWCLTLSLIGPPLLRWALISPPKRYIDYDAWVSSLLALDQIAVLASGASTLILLALPLYALIFKRN